jgi:hypothetical protein
MITFLLGGLWHGAGWTFVFWGFLHGIALCIHRVWKYLGFTLPKVIAWIVTFNFVNVAWVFFRAKEWDDAIKVLKGMAGGEIIISKEFSSLINYINPMSDYFYIKGEAINSFTNMYLLEMLIFSFIIISLKNSMEHAQKFNELSIVSFKNYFIFILVFGYSLIVMSLQTGSEFLYFNF